MAEIGYGYGSEWQLLRCLGHHRNEFFEALNKTLKLAGPIEWLDYPYNSKRVSHDGEHTGIKFIKHIEFIKNNDSLKQKITEGWKEFWPSQGTPPNWDGIFTCNNTLYIVEAKGHVTELQSYTNSKLDQITEALKQTIETYTIDPKTTNIRPWKKDHYQLANRLAFVYFMNKQGVTTKLVNIHFLNAWEGTAINVDSEETWREAVKKEHELLNLDHTKLRGDCYDIYYDCSEDKRYDNLDL